MKLLKILRFLFMNNIKLKCESIKLAIDILTLKIYLAFKSFIFLYNCIETLIHFLAAV